MAKSPAFQWYPKDILSSVRVAEMSLAEEGAYRRLIDFCWLNGSIPADPIRASRVVGKGCTREITEAVLPMFTPDPNDPTRLVHDRLEEERRRQEEATFVDCIAFGKTGDAIAKFFDKGRQILIEGKLAQSNKQTKAGDSIKTLKVVVDRFEFVGNREGTKEANATFEKSSQRSANETYQADEEIPF